MKLLRYKKNFDQDGITQEAQEKLFNSRVLVMGAGGLGSGVIVNLAAMGVGQIKIIDDDIVEESNLNRQFIHKYKNIGRAKVISAKDWVQEFNSDVKVELDKIRLNELNYFNVIQGFDIIVDCFDSCESKYMLNEIALRHNKILIHGGVQGFRGQITTIVPSKTGCLSCVMQKPRLFKEENYASISPVVNVISSLQAQEVLKVVTGIGEPLMNKIMIFDGLKSEFKILNYARNIACEVCSNIEGLYGRTQS